MSQATQSKPAAAKDELFADPSELVCDRDWNGRWQAIPIDRPAEADADKKKGDTQIDANRVVTIRQLGDSIRTKGQLEHVLIIKRPADDQGRIWHVVAGQQRTRAIDLINQEDPNAGLKVRCRILPAHLTDAECFEINEEENRVRNNLTLLDKAFNMSREKAAGKTAEEISKKWDCSIQAVDQALKLIQAPPEVQQAVADKVITATTVIDTFRGVDDNSQIAIVARAREAKAKGTPFRPADLKELARQAKDAAPPATPAAATPPSANPGQANGTTPDAGPAAPVKPAKSKPGPKAGKKVPRAVSEIRLALQGREGVVSTSILRFFDGDIDMGNAELCAVLDAYEYEKETDGVDLHPRTEGNEIPADATTAATTSEV